MLNKIRITAVLIFASLLLSGCFEVSTEITVNKDGSGLLYQKVMFSEMLVSQMTSMTEGMGDGEEESMYDEEKLKEEASKYGEGVVFKSGTAVSESGKAGYEVYYSFSDIRNVRVGNDPSSVIEMGETADAENLITFDFKKGETALMTVIMPEDMDEGETAEPLQEPDNIKDEETAVEPEMEESAMAMMKQLFSGMKFSYKVYINGEITDTDAENREGSAITLVEMDFDRIMNNPEAFKNLENMQGDDSDKAVKAMKDIDGVKVEMKNRIRVEFR